PVTSRGSHRRTAVNVPGNEAPAPAIVCVPENDEPRFVTGAENSQVVPPPGVSSKVSVPDWLTRAWCKPDNTYVSAPRRTVRLSEPARSPVASDDCVRVRTPVAKAVLGGKSAKNASTS